jgi:uncharacterized DUF497 family protein
MDFEWNANKARENESKHRIGFVEAMEVFGDALSSTVSDPDHSLEEERFVIFGRTRKRKYLVVAFTEPGGRIRVISARPMTRRERSAYEQ